MRSRPAVELRFHPAELFPGSTLHVDASFQSLTDTPVDALSLTLSGIEAGVLPAGKSTQRYTHTHVALQARFEPQRFLPGVHRYRASFELPATLPPSHVGRLTSVTYELRVLVDIPWWLDLDRSYLVHVSPTPEAPRKQRFVFRSQQGDVRGDALFAEATLEQADLPPGGVLHGAVSLANTAGTKMRGVRLDLIAYEHVSMGWGVRSELARYTARLCDGRPKDGEALHFRVRLPPEAPCSYRGAITRVEWVAQVSAEHLLSSTPLLEIPLMVVPLRGSTEPELGGVLPAVGRARRALLWQQVAAQLGVLFDAETDTLHGDAGAVGFTLRAEQQKGGPTLVARLSWRPLGIELEVRPASWLEGVTGKGILLGDEPFDRAWYLTGRTREQVAAALSPEVRRALEPWSDGHLDDRSGTVSLPGAGVDDNTVRKVVSDVLVLARALSESLPKVPIPAALAHLEAPWRAFAATLGGRFEPGPVRITSVLLEGAALELGLEWLSAEEQHTVAVALLDPPVEPARLEAARNAAQGPYAAALREATTLAAGATLSLQFDRVAAYLPARLEAPARAEPLLRALARLARSLYGQASTAPFR